jgi:hypothetical protein
MILVYIAGPFTADTPEEIDANIDAAEKVAAQIIGSSERFSVICPHSLGRNFKDGPGSPEYWYKATMTMAKTCDVVVTVPGWEKSRGSIKEVDFFSRTRRGIYHSAADLLLELGKE